MAVAIVSTAAPLASGAGGSATTYVHSLLDDRSRVAYSQLLDDETGATSAWFLVQAASFFASLGVTIQRVLTDNAKAHTHSQRFLETASDLGIRLRRTRPYRPQTNGKVERFHRTLKDEWAYGRAYQSNAERRLAFQEWLEFYNHRRPHSALNGLTPMAVLVNNVHGNHT
jgi:transposase InsO family protein